MDKYSDLFDIFEKFPEHIEKSLFDLHKSQMNESCFLHEAVKENKFQIVKKLLRYGLDPNLKDAKGMSPLQYATQASDLKIEMIQELLEYGANPNIEDNSGCTPLGNVCYVYNNGQIDKKVEIVSLLISHGAKVNHQDIYGDSILLSAAYSYKGFELIAKLLKNGGNPHILGYGKNSILHLIASNDSNAKDFVKIIELPEMGQIDVNFQNNLGDTPLHDAVEQSGNVEVVRTLLKMGAEKNIKNNEGFTPYELALHFKHTEIAKIFMMN